MLRLLLPTGHLRSDLAVTHLLFALLPSPDPLSHLLQTRLGLQFSQQRVTPVTHQSHQQHDRDIHRPQQDRTVPSTYSCSAWTPQHSVARKSFRFYTCRGIQARGIPLPSGIIIAKEVSHLDRVTAEKFRDIQDALARRLHALECQCALTGRDPQLVVAAVNDLSRCGRG